MNGILDLPRGLHANEFALCGEDTFGIRTHCVCLSFFLSERVDLCSMLTLQLSASVSWRWGCVLVCVHGIAGST